MTSTDRDLVMGITPFHEPNADLVVAIERAGFLGVLDLGQDAVAARAALERVRRRLGRPFGVRISGGCALSPVDLPPEVDTVLVDPVGAWGTCAGRVLAEVTSAQEAREALRHGATGLVARGFEAGGRIAGLSTFVLVQRLVSEFDVPVWAAGGIGPRTAAAAVAGGARGVAIDSQLALVAESELPAEVAAAIMAMDGSETRVHDGYRVYVRPGLPAIKPEVGCFGARDLREQLLPVGQDGAFAASLAARFKTAGGVVRAIGEAATSQIELAVEIQPLKDAVPVQGPMTRVSDRAEFAAAVAAAGGLPFLALALMSGDQTRDLLAGTARLLGDRPWGVGILGFAPAEVREAQLAAIRDIHPPCALIAGGRPSQAAALQETGIETFLHVPSPGLLDQFLRDGARRFVFEGAECGGHIGPRGSFALWEAQISRLLEQPDLDEVRVWFAGGVHDERSAAMVAAMAAPLAERGARVSVLMGTAYLFTDEVVESGAVVPLYQRAARECTVTALLESSPGHVIRCADTPYVSAFAEARGRLAGEGEVGGGVSQQDAWAELEQLNLGRLRIAAKGLRRDGETLVAVGEAEARADGMFMLGQVATLRSDVTTVAALHEQVTSGATSFLAARAAALSDRGDRGGKTARPLDVAIVGMACIYPGADGLGTYWANVVAGVDAIRDVPPERWQPATYPGVPSARGGFIPPVPFDALRYGIPPTALGSIEPVQLLALEVAARALADAGYAERPFDRDRTSVIFGAEPGSELSAAYGLRSVLPAYTGRLPGELDEHLPRLTEDSFPGVLGNVIAGRIANRLDLGGVNYSVDAACASSLAALDLACKELVSGTSDMVLCGGADTHNGIHDYEMFASVHALSPEGRCATFDAAADGIALGEGAGCVVVKRLADAERDGDRIYAVIKGVGGSSDGRSLGLTAPRPEGQRRAVDRAYEMAGVSPADVGLIEAHGTGTVAGDRAELATLTAVFTESGAEPGNCTIGSVKSQIGHTKCAAGLAGLIKVACALHTGVRPGTIHLNDSNPYWNPGSSPFTFTGGGARPWSSPPGARYAGVSAFGFGGTNFHAVLSGYDGADEPLHGLRDWPAELFVLRGDAGAEHLQKLVAANDAAGRPWRLAELAATMAARTGPVRAAFVADDLDDPAAKLSDPLPGEGPGGPVAFLFPGQGSQRPGMAGHLFAAFPRLQRLLRLGDRRYAEVMFPPAAFTRADREHRTAAITDTRVAQPALGIADLAICELLAMVGVRPDMAAGHSYGEFVALCAAGAYPETDLFDLSEIRARAILEAAGEDPGTMAAVSAPASRVGAFLDGTGVVIANYNAPGQTVISGATPAVEAAVEALTAQGISARRIPVACAFHSPVVAGAAVAMAEALAGRDLSAPRFPVFANSTAAPYPGTPGGVRKILADQVAEPVRFTEQIEAMYEAGARTFIEAGPGRVLTGLVDRILGDLPHTAVACDVPGENGLRRFVTMLAELIRAGVPVDPRPLFTKRAEPVTGTPKRPQWLIDGHLVRTADGNPLDGGLQPATLAPRLSLDEGSLGAGSSPAAERDNVVTEFLRTTRELVAAQRDVLLGYLGAAPPPPAPSLLTVAAPSAAANSNYPERAGQLPPEPEPAGPASRAEIGEAIVSVISARTGYPLDMLGADLDLEADLSIDSIKRTEIIAALAERLGLAGAGAAVGDSVMEQLARIKTITGITDWLAGHIGGESSHGAGTPGEPPGPGPDLPRTGRPRRFLADTVDLAPAAGDSAPQGRFLIVDDGRGIALELAELLEQRGAETVTAGTPANEELTEADALVHLGALRPGAGPVLPGAFEQVRDALAGGAGTVLVATAAGGTFGHACEPDNGEPCDLGLRGMVRTIAAEYPDVLARAVDVEPKETPRTVAAQLLAELTDRAGPSVVGYRAGRRVGLRVLEAEVLPPPDGIGLDRESVVLLTGGARGITASVALALARATGCHIELIGRTPAPGPADPEIADVTDPGELRRILIGRGMDSPREIEAEAGRIFRERETRATLGGLREVAASVRYHAIDVRDAAAVRALVDDVYARYARLDGVIHGAGVLEDRLVPDKTPESFERVYATKVDGARALMAGLRDDARFFVLFGSVSGVFGNRGQVDYAAANDALGSLARLWSARRQRRVVSVDWGPWAGGGMVSAELEREYARRGVTLIDQDEGVTCLFAEIAAASGPPQVIYMCDEVPGD
jgi:acyl transferase domain-containing protein/NAD(P)H-dependent flavin oxidoreductase YrpB (nitropropane dioxygenase family)